MPQTIKFENGRIKKSIIIPRLKSICPKEKTYYKDIFFMIYKNNDKTYPNIGEIDWQIKLYNRTMIKCYVATRDTLDMIESVLFPNLEKREDFATLIEELSELHDTENKKIEDVKIEYEKIEEIYERDKNVLTPACDLYKFCYYWISLCIALDFRVVEGQPTFIRRSLIVKDAIYFIRGKISREDFGRSWNDVKKRVDPSEMIIGIKYNPVKGYEKELKSDVFVNKKGETISVGPHGRLTINTE